MAAVGFPVQLQRRSAWAVSLVCLVVVPILLGGCGTTRSVAAYCQVFYGQGAQVRNNLAPTNDSDPFEVLGSLVDAPSELANFFGQLDAVAPASIEPDVAAMQHTFQQEAGEQSNVATDPLDDIVGGLLGGLGSQQAAQAVTTWTLHHCGRPPGSSSGTN
jgi:hypothetical protein